MAMKSPVMTAANSNAAPKTFDRAKYISEARNAFADAITAAKTKQMKEEQPNGQ